MDARVTVVHVDRLAEYARRHPDAEAPLQAWLRVVEAATWRHLMDVRKTYKHADAVKVASGRTVTIFNVKGNDYRLITAIDYPLGIVNALLFLTHAEYDKDKWKYTL